MGSNYSSTNELALYKPEMIYDDRVRKGIKEYRVHWKNTHTFESYESWETNEFPQSEQLICEYLKRKELEILYKIKAAIDIKRTKSNSKKSIKKDLEFNKGKRNINR